ncbi:MAG TPA: CHAT domain-containing tetratricopeptide repeat protein [Trichocoleus sp.]
MNRPRLTCQKLAFFTSLLLFVPFKVQPVIAQTFMPNDIAVTLPLPENLPGVVEFLLFGWGNSPEHRNRQSLRQATEMLHQGRKLKDSQDYPGAIAAYTEAIHLAQNLQEFDLEKTAILKTSYFDLGTVYLNVENYQKGVEQFQTALQFVDNYSDLEKDSLYTLLGFAYWKNGDTDSAEKILWRVIRSAEVRIILPQLNMFATPHSQIDQGVVNNTAAAYKAADLLQAIYIDQGNFTTALEIADRLRARVLLDYLLESFPDGRISFIDVSTYYQAVDELALTFPQIQKLSETLSATLVVYSRVSQDTLYIWVVRPQEPLVFQSVHLSQNGSVLLEIAQSFRARADRNNALISLERDSTIPNIGQANIDLVAAYDQLIAPIEFWLPQDEAAQVIFVPHQELFALPFAAFKAPDGQQLIDRWSISLAPSLQSLVVSGQIASSAEGREPKVLVFSNPSPMPEDLPDLPGALLEGRSIAGLQSNVSVLEGKYATEANLKRLVKDATILHLATHGILDDDNNINSWLAFASSTDEDGKLTVEEIFQLDLAAELVIMSACETGLGSITGEGILGMSRAFMSAGTSSIVSSLWPVPDDATVFLMTVFHQELNQGSSKSYALRTAMLATRAKYPYPVDWAGFALMGNPY